MRRIIKFLAIFVTLVFCAKTFSTSFYALNQYPRHFYLKAQIGEYSHSTTYLWITFLTNLAAFISGFWLFAGLCENSFAFFAPAFFVIVIFLVEDFLSHCVLFVIYNDFHALMKFNFFTTTGFALAMYIVYRSSKYFSVPNLEPALRPVGDTIEVT